LWLGPVPDRPYHPNYTHNVFRGWYDFGGGSIADMGHYSLFPLFVTLGIETPPISAEAYGTTTRTIVDQVSRPVNYANHRRSGEPASEQQRGLPVLLHDPVQVPKTEIFAGL
jgi:hypothetical protein